MKNWMRPVGSLMMLMAIAATILSTTPARSENTLTKMGNAIQYPVRKLGENTSMLAHKVTNSKSVEKDRPADARFVVKPNGDKIYKSTNNDRLNRRLRYLHRHHRHHHH